MSTIHPTLVLGLMSDVFICARHSQQGTATNDSGNLDVPLIQPSVDVVSVCVCVCTSTTGGHGYADGLKPSVQAVLPSAYVYADGGPRRLALGVRASRLSPFDPRRIRLPSA